MHNFFFAKQHNTGRSQIFTMKEIATDRALHISGICNKVDGLVYQMHKKPEHEYEGILAARENMRCEEDMLHLAQL